jgi:hypothetical protein
MQPNLNGIYRSIIRYIKKRILYINWRTNASVETRFAHVTVVFLTLLPRRFDIDHNQDVNYTEDLVL